MINQPNPIANKSARLLNNITFFGDSAIAEDSEIYKQIWTAARVLAENGFTIVNGGGPGVMKAATDGAESVNGNTIAVYWQPKLASFFEGKNLANITDESETATNYMTRTLGLIEKGDAYIVCKGGTGTVSEFGMVWALAKLYYGCHKPVILFGDFWDPIIETLQKQMNIDETELGVLYQATEVQQIIDILAKHELRLGDCRGRKDLGEESAFILSPRHEANSVAYDSEARTYDEQHAGKPSSYEQLDEFISLVHPPAKVLDLGTGFGFDAKYLAKKYTITGVEISPKTAAIAKFENPGMEIVVEDMVNYDFGKGKFKGIWARNSLHHIEEKFIDTIFEKAYTALVEEGIFYIIVREGKGEMVETDARGYQKVEKFYHLFDEQEISDRARKAGFAIEKLETVTRSHNWLNIILRKPNNHEINS